MAEATETHCKARELPGHDIFCTPENSDFLSKVPYRELDATKREIRLLKILPDSGSGFVECELLPSVRLADVRKQYLALSYCAGDARNTKTIIVNGARCNVFANLHHALRAVRRYWKKHADQQDFLLWVDQLCINQANLTERSHQVGFMREIYQNAKRTLICLSTRDTKGLGMKWLIELQPNWKNYIESVPQLHDNSFNNLRELLWENLGRKEFTDGWIAFYDICESPWWRRAWVAQEYMVSNQTTFVFGPRSISDLSLKDLMEGLFMSGLGPASLTDERHFLRHVDYDIDSSRRQQFYRVVNHVKKLQPDKTERTVKAMFSIRYIPRDNSDLKRLLMDSRYREASDERDRIYSVIGLADPGYGIVPNYSPENHWNNVLVETTRKIITFENNLDVLSCARNCGFHTPRSRALPSWVINWNRTNYDLEEPSSIGYTPGAPRYGIIYKERADASFKNVPNPRGSQATTITAMEVWGVFVDTILSPAIPQDSSDPFSSYDYYNSAKGYKVGVRSHTRLKHNHELWILCGSCEPLLLEPKSDGYCLVDVVYCPELQGAMPTVPDSLKGFLNKRGFIDTVKMGRRRITIL
ncbi:hypothetical protein NW762_003258 [Fusarium torreyae]|uniref:Heterokaryon incompatibility domain-containing protein n=1 Tax=Fusarium torreyae TaxID=1237075 RepID=A0A9W8SA21_9HYPO|nr:hypothetical protein NW762_003258 [Fusarium torreyae]